MENAQSFRRRRERILVDDVIIVTDAVLLLLLLGGGGGHASSSRSESAVVRFIRENRNRASLSLSLFNFGAEREADFKNLNALLSLFWRKLFSLRAFKKKRALDSRLLSLSLTELFLFLSVSGDCWESRRARVLFFFFRQRAKKNEKFSLSACLRFSLG